MTRQRLVHVHPKREHLHKPAATREERIATAVTNALGSMTFIKCQTVAIILWVMINGFVVVLRWDPYPFILLNLMFSTQAAYAAPFILLTQNRQAERDRELNNTEAAEVEEIRDMSRKQIEQNARIEKISNDQTTILNEQTEMLKEIREMRAALNEHMEAG